MGARWFTAVAVLMAGISSPGAAEPSRAFDRVISLDVCADQYALKLLDRKQIEALSPDATAAFSHMAAMAKGLKQVRPTAEEVLARRPDAVIRSWGGGPGIAGLLEGAGIKVIQIGFAGNLGDIAGITRRVGDDLGVSDRAEALARSVEHRLAALPDGPSDLHALYMTATGVTSGSGTLMDDMMARAGLVNYQVAPGWRSLPLESLALKSPDLIIAAFFGQANVQQDQWSATRHPVAQRHLKNKPVVHINGALTACGGWFLLDAAEQLARHSQSVIGR